MPETMVTPVANIPMASLKRSRSKVGRLAHRFLSSKVPPSLAALTSNLPIDWAT